jgi:hypothetical protein
MWWLSEGATVIWLLLLEQTYRAMASGAVHVVVQCAHCDAVFNYRLERTAYAYISQYFSTISQAQKDRAADQAQEKLHNLLDQDFNCIPCPSCGEYQPSMVERLKVEQYRWMLRYQDMLLYLAGLCAVGALIFAVLVLADAAKLEQADWLLALGLGLTGFLCATACLGTWAAIKWAHGTWTAKYDPNDPAHHQERLAQGKEMAKSGFVEDEDEPRAGAVRSVSQSFRRR